MPVLAIIILVTIADQVTKLLVSRHFQLGESIQVIPGFFNLTCGRNTGAALGMLRDSNGALMLFSIVILVLLIIFRRFFMAETRGHRIAAAFMIGGIVGNLLDRFRLGFVVDFLDFYWRNWHFWTFNIADSSICIGVAVYVIATYVHGKRSGTTQPEEGLAP